MNKTLKEVLKDYRQAHGLTKRQMAELIGAKANSYYEWEYGACHPKSEEIRQAITEMTGFKKWANQKRKCEAVTQVSKGINICIDCINAVPTKDDKYGCKWSRELKPVKGWTAVKTKLSNTWTWHITQCPEFKKG